MDSKMFHQKYPCHIFHLTVKAGIKTQGVNALIVKFKNTLHHIFFKYYKKTRISRLMCPVGFEQVKSTMGCRYPLELDL
jgi:hypothetical protein